MNATRHPLSNVLAITAVLLLGACASTPPPTEQMAVAEAALVRANTSGTSENAVVELQTANAKLAGARQAMADKDYVRARQLAEQAQMDAQVAELHAQSTRSRKAAQESQDAARVLNDELNRKTTVR